MANSPTNRSQSASVRARLRWDQTTDPAARTAATEPARTRAASRFRDEADPDRTLDTLHELAGGDPVVADLADARRRRHFSDLAKKAHRVRRQNMLAAMAERAA